MNNTERIVIRELVKSLKESTRKNWEYGDVEDWAKFGCRMMNTIGTVVPVLEKLVDDGVNKDNT